MMNNQQIHLTAWAQLREHLINERRDQIRELADRGLTAQQIAHKLGIANIRTVQRDMQIMGISTPQGSRFTENEWQQAKQMLDQGCSYKHVAQALGRPTSVISYHFPGRGWTHQKAGKKRAAMKVRS